MSLTRTGLAHWIGVPPRLPIAILNKNIDNFEKTLTLNK